MIVRKKNGIALSSSTIYGIAGGAFGLVTIGFMIQSQLAPETYPACSGRYAKAGVFALSRASGQAYDPVQLQSKLAGQDWGVLRNVAIEQNKSAPQQTAMVVKFGAGGAFDRAARNAASGMGFKWRPSYLKNASSACLTYSVRLPKDFQFATGGTLPGLSGASQTAAPGKKDEFSLRMRWLEFGRIGIQSYASATRVNELIQLSPKWLRLPREQWFTIEQEIVLNTPGQSDGILRVWIDGRLHLNRSGLAFRKNADGRIAGVIADTHYSDGNLSWTPAPKPTAVKLSPLVVRWK